MKAEERKSVEERLSEAERERWEREREKEGESDTKKQGRREGEHDLT